MKLELQKRTAKRLFPDAPDWFQKIMKETFGEDFFKKKHFTEIKTFSDACEAIGTTEEEFNKRWENLGLPNDTISYEKVKIVVKAINQGWTPDWDNSNQQKWFPIFNLSSGFGFSYSHYYYGITFTHVGSRLCFESEEKSDYAAKQFIDLYKQFIK